MTDTEMKFLTITDVSRLTGYCVSYLRELADRGVVIPKRTSTGIRLFTCADVGALKARRDEFAARIPE